MPNWCSNTLIVEGDLNELVDFKSKVLVPSETIKGDLDFTMEGLYPTPPELLEMTSPVMWRGDETDEEGKKAFEENAKAIREKYGFDDWYNWRVSCWGTKWDASDSYVDERDGESLCINYTTAWGPNSAFIRYASTLFPNLHFKLSYEEAGMGFCGCYEVVNGGEDFEDLMEGDLEWKDEDTDRLVTYDSELERYRYVDTNEVIDDEDFYPQEFNPFA
jgi:hypothetical protein